MGVGTFSCRRVYQRSLSEWFRHSAAQLSTHETPARRSASRSRAHCARAQSPPPPLLLPLPVSLLYTHSLHCRRCARCAAWGRGAQPWFSTPVLQWLSDSLRARQVTSPVMWEKTMALMMERGYEQGYELGPGKVVAGIIKPPPPPSY